MSEVLNVRSAQCPQCSMSKCSMSKCSMSKGSMSLSLKIVSIYHLVKLCSFKLLKSPTEKPEENSTLSKTLFRRRRRSLFEFSFESRDNDAKAIVQPLSYKREETNYKFWTLRRLPLFGWELFHITWPGRNIELIFGLTLSTMKRKVDAGKWKNHTISSVHVAHSSS